MQNLNTENLNNIEKGFLCSVINRFGGSEHPTPTNETLKFFRLNYIKECLKKVNKKILTEKGLNTFYDIKNKI